MKKYIVLFLLVETIFGYSQATLSGTIRDAKNKQPTDATVYIPKLEKGSITDFDGKYTITNIPAGTFSVVISSLGYKTVSKEITFQQNATITLNITLEESAVEMEEVIISTPFHQLQKDNVMKVERVNLKQLSQQGLANLSQGITSISGVSSISTGVSIGKPVIRGLSSNRVLTYTQGVRLENQQFGGEHGLGVNEAGIESVEVIKGPASLLYGSDALGGILYLNPEKFAPQDSLKIEASSRYFSNTQGTSTTVGVKKSFKNFKFLVRGAYDLHSDYKTGDGTRVTNSRYNENDLKAGIGYRITNFKTSLRYNYNVSNLGLPEEIGKQTTSKKLITPFQKIVNQMLSSSSTLYFTNSSIETKLGYSTNNRKEFEEYGKPALGLLLKTGTYDIKYHLPKLGKFKTIAGVQGMYQTNKNFGEEILIPNATKKDFGVMATTHYHLESIDLQLGARFDTRNIITEDARNPEDFNFIPSLSRKFTSFNGAFGVKKDFYDEKLSIRLNLASGYRAPNLAELTSNGIHEGSNRYEIGNADLKNEQNFQTDLAMEFKTNHFDVFVNGFYNTIRNYIFLSPTGDEIENNQVYTYLQSDASLYGGEAGIHIHPHPLDWLHLESSFETVTGKQKTGEYLPLIPANAISNTLRIALEDTKKRKNAYAFFTTKITFKQSHVSLFETHTNGYTLLNAGIGTFIKGKNTTTTIFATATNLTDVNYIAHLSRLKNDGIANIGRNITIGLKISN